jgi:hypothetical protein
VCECAHVVGKEGKKAASRPAIYLLLVLGHECLYPLLVSAYLSLFCFVICLVLLLFLFFEIEAHFVAQAGLV